MQMRLVAAAQPAHVCFNGHDPAIAQHYGVRVSDLRNWNDLTADDMLKPGARLIVAPPGGGAPEVTTESMR